MSYSVVSIARTLAAGGEDVGGIVARDLGYRYLDNAIVGRAAAKAKVSPEMVAEAEKTQPLLIRILDALGRGGIASGEGAYVPAPVMTDPGPDPELYATLIEEVIKEAAREGKAVIVGHGAGIALIDTPGALRVFITASAPVRAERYAHEQNVGIKDAMKAIEDSDKQRRDFLRRLYEVDEEVAAHYDLVINTDEISMAKAAALVVAAAKD
jgi:cytidylate kinase